MAFRNNAVVNITVQVPVWTGAIVLLDVRLREELPDYTVTLCLIV